MTTSCALRLGAIRSAALGFFHCKVAYDICRLGTQDHALAQGRLFRLAAYMLSIARFAIIVAA